MLLHILGLLIPMKLVSEKLSFCFREFIRRPSQTYQKGQWSPISSGRNWHRYDIYGLYKLKLYNSIYFWILQECYCTGWEEAMKTLQEKISAPSSLAWHCYIQEQSCLWESQLRVLSDWLGPIALVLVTAAQWWEVWYLLFDHGSFWKPL